MRGYSHALSGAVTGAAVGELILHLPLTGTLTLSAFTAGWATWNDLDQTGSCAARSLGFASELVARVIRKLSGGHRHLTHSVLGVAIFTALAWAACHYRHSVPGEIALGVFLLLGIAAGLGALRLGGHRADAIALAAAGVIVWTGWGLALVPLATGLGMGTHVCGDMLTVQGCPLLDPLTSRHFGLPRPVGFTTGTWRETRVVVPVLFAALFGLAVWAVDPAIELSVWAHVSHAI